MAKYRAKKRLGQHFLTSKDVIEKIVRLVEQQDPERILEIGPGRGILTEGLADLGTPILAVEFDRDLIGYLKKRLRRVSQLTILNEDILKYSPLEHGFERGTIVGNLPYNITSPVIDWCVRNRSVISSAILMMQREVAARLVASPGSKDWSPLALFTQLYFTVSLEFDVGPEAFDPPPEVTSSIVKLTPRVPVSIANFKIFERVVRAGFTQRRKQLLNNLVPKIIPDSDSGKEMLTDIGLDQNIRAEQLSAEQFLRLTDLLIERNIIK